MTEIPQKQVTIGKIPAILWGEPGEKLYIYVHGLCGCKEEAESFSSIVCPRGWQVLSLDLPGHGERKHDTDGFVPWQVVPELQSVLAYAQTRWERIAVRATSIGAWFCMMSFENEPLERCLFVSPVPDMNYLIENMMRQAGITDEQLKKEQIISTQSGQALSWKYLTYVREHPIVNWEKPTRILYAENDNLIDLSVVDDFSRRFHCHLTIMKGGEHWFHTPEQLAVLHSWIEENC